ncbi:hypothetical protein MFLO_15995 [Listeria floridensis FSL S10-1187]|uniref:Uncharacterized protein n=1 Tax=Listeria floridensis FSL S10-1187 TaxID=1265817 RepID=A0ABN0RB39_9LIST|nr:hypothetical protein [Listeria floridensis]EUJ23364.1 hypothetical protein MFLO_15995 [Listeria floridensis FSL S10-1187]
MTKELFDKKTFLKNAKKLKLNVMTIKKGEEGGIFYREKKTDDWKELTADNFFDEEALLDILNEPRIYGALKMLADDKEEIE